MGDFFKPWRRKLGVVTLLMALVFMAGWVRSNHTMDTVQFRIPNKSLNFFVSNQSWLYWQCLRDPFQSQLTAPLPINGVNSLRIPLTRFHFVKQANTIDHFEVISTETFNVLLGDQKGLHSTIRFNVWGVPYWSITIPLTLISAFLLLSKPRPTNSKKLPEPIPAEGA